MFKTAIGVPCKEVIEFLAHLASNGIQLAAAQLGYGDGDNAKKEIIQECKRFYNESYFCLLLKLIGSGRLSRDEYVIWDDELTRKMDEQMREDLWNHLKGKCNKEELEKLLITLISWIIKGIKNKYLK